MSDFNPIDGLSNFFLYLHLWTGKIDDLNDLEKELSLLHDKPVSVVIVVLRSEEVKINNDFVQIQERMIKFQQRTRKFITFIRIDLNTKKIEFKKKINRIIWESISHFESFIDKFRFELDRKEHKSIELESNLLKLSSLDINHQSFVNPSIFEDYLKN